MNYPSINLTKEEEAHFETASVIDAAFIIGFDVFLLACAGFLGTSETGGLKLLGLLLVCRQQAAFYVLFHEGIHKKLVKRPAMNHWLVKYCLSPLLGIHVEAYQFWHQKHHTQNSRYLGPSSLSLGLAAQRALKHYFIQMSPINWLRKSLTLGEKKIQVASPAGDYLIILSFQVALTLAFAWVISSYFWLYFWWLPLLSGFQFLLNFRSQIDPSLALLTDLSWGKKAIYRLLVPHYWAFRPVHQAYPRIPFYRLAAVQKVLAKRQIKAEEKETS